MSDNKKFWWEKTVEYLFVKQHVDIEDLIVPLDGKHELAGDAIIGKVAKWLLIEFKRNSDSLNTEFDKFGGENNFKAAKNKLKKRSRHHLLIYGDLVNKKLALKSRYYFKNEEVQIESALKHGKSLDAFNQYLKDLRAEKSNSDNESGSGENSFDYSRVIGVTESGEASECMTVDDYEKHVSKDIELKLKAELREALESKQEAPEEKDEPSVPKPRF